jgi:Mn-dependent DtxR family transcriptional regulator
MTDITTTTLAKRLGVRTHTVARLVQDLAALQPVSRHGRRYLLTPRQADLISEAIRTHTGNADFRRHLESIVAQHAEHEPISMADLSRTLHEAHCALMGAVRCAEHHRDITPHLRDLSHALTVLQHTTRQTDHLPDEYRACATQIADLTRLIGGLAPAIISLADQLAIYMPHIRADLTHHLRLTTSDPCPDTQPPSVSTSSGNIDPQTPSSHVGATALVSEPASTHDEPLSADVDARHDPEPVVQHPDDHYVEPIDDIATAELRIPAESEATPEPDYDHLKALAKEQKDWELHAVYSTEAFFARLISLRASNSRALDTILYEQVPFDPTDQALIVPHIPELTQMTAMHIDVLNACMAQPTLEGFIAACEEAGVGDVLPAVERAITQPERHYQIRVAVYEAYTASRTDSN